MVDLDPIPLADDDRTWTGATPPRPAPEVQARSSRPQAAGPRRPLIAVGFLFTVSLAHGLAIWQGMGGARDS